MSDGSQRGKWFRTEPGWLGNVVAVEPV